MHNNFQLYEPLTEAPPPINLVAMKCYLRVTHTLDDPLIQRLIDAATHWGENYCGRDFRKKTWRLLLNFFEDRMRLLRSPADTVDLIEYIKGGAFVPVPVADVYIVHRRQFSEILWVYGKTFPVDGDPREQSVKIEFTTKAVDNLPLIKTAILRHVAYLYQNRGDCDDASGANAQSSRNPGVLTTGNTNVSALASGATSLYDQFRISRV